MILFLVLSYSLILLAFNEALRRLPILVAIIFALLPLLLTPYWYNVWQQDWFIYIKVYSVAIAQLWKLSIRFTKLNEKKWALQIVYLILTLNILEASIVDFMSGYYTNSFIGVILVLTLANYKAMKVDKTLGFRDFLYDTPLSWVVAYSVWNFTFICANYPDYYCIHIAVLLTSVGMTLYNNKLWNQTRGFTLGTHLIIQATYPGIFEKVGFVQSISIYTYNFILVASIVAALTHVLYYFSRK